VWHSDQNRPSSRRLAFRADTAVDSSGRLRLQKLRHLSVGPAQIRNCKFQVETGVSDFCEKGDCQRQVELAASKAVATLFANQREMGCAQFCRFRVAIAQSCELSVRHPNLRHGDPSEGYAAKLGHNCKVSVAGRAGWTLQLSLPPGIERLLRRARTRTERSDRLAIRCTADLGPSVGLKS